MPGPPTYRKKLRTMAFTLEVDYKQLWAFCMQADSLLGDASLQIYLSNINQFLAFLLTELAGSTMMDFFERSRCDLNYDFKKG